MLAAGFGLLFAYLPTVKRHKPAQLPTVYLCVVDDIHDTLTAKRGAFCEARLDTVLRIRSVKFVVPER